MAELLDIAEVVRRTGLTSRALRFWEARGLLKPLRTASGRRFYGPDALERLHAVIALKRAGFSLGAIGGMLGNRRADLGRLVTAQLAELDTRARELADTRSLLSNILSRIDSGERIDVATLCSLIRKGPMMEPENWKNVTDRYFSPEEQARFAATMPQMPEGFEPEEYGRQWSNLGARIEAALPLDPASAPAGDFVEEWFTLLRPFTRVATPEMMAGTTRMYENMNEWEGQADPGFTHRVFLFIQDAAKAHPERTGVC